MQIIYLLAGLAIFLFTVTDLFKTTFSANGGGALTRFISDQIWNLIFRLSKKNGRSSVLNYAGSVVLISILVSWITGFWLALFLLLLSEDRSVLNATTLQAASVIEKLYYAGFTLSTLGIGDYQAGSNFFRILTSVATFSGLAFITAAITYFVPVLSAVELQSQLSLYVYSMGKAPQTLLTNSWNGKNFDSFIDNISDLCQKLNQHIMNHHSYPVLHYFHHNSRRLAVIPALALLHDAYYLLKFGVEDEVEKDPLKMVMLETTLQVYLQTMQESYLKDNYQQLTPPMPDLRVLKQKSIPFSEEKVQVAFSTEILEQRQRITQLLKNDGWTWEDVYKSAPEEK